MKPAMKFVLLAVFVSVSGIVIAQMAALTPSQTAQPPSILTVPTNGSLTLSNSLPDVSMELPLTSQPPKPGVYQSKPYTCIVLVPKPTQDNCCPGGILNTNSRMTIFKPDSQLIPVPQKGE
jgi:hypothetical protein